MTTMLLRVLVVMLALMASRAHAVECGAVVTTDTVLTADVGPCDVLLGVITVIGPATLDLNGHTVSGLEQHPDHCIALDGRGATVRNGSVADCVTGVVVIGTGGHRIERVTAYDMDRAFHVASSQNRLEKNHAVRSVQGFRVRGSRNRLLRNVVAAGKAGFVVSGGHHLLQENVASGLTERGFWVQAEHDEAASHRLIGNVAIAVAQEGFLVQAPAARLDGNRAISSGAGGIVVETGHAVVSRNVAADNHPYDLISPGGSCATTTWRTNVAGTRNASCID